MDTQGITKVVIDTCVLIKFLAIDRLDLLAQHPSYQFIITDHVRREITDHYPEQLSRLEAGLSAGHLEQTSVSDKDELDAFAQLSKDGRLGSGECSAIAAASQRSFRLAIDDTRARKQAQHFYPNLQLLNTQSLIVSMIQSGTLDITAADAIKDEWELHHSFRMKFASFADVQ